MSVYRKQPLLVKKGELLLNYSVYHTVTAHYFFFPHEYTKLLLTPIALCVGKDNIQYCQSNGLYNMFL